MKEQKDKARASNKFQNLANQEDWINILDTKGSSFQGYDKNSLSGQMIKYRYLNNNLEIIMDQTPFYAESGGQIGDIGTIVSDNIHLEVIDTYKIGEDICHLCNLKKGDLNDSINNILWSTF